jgi:hypothetical protein
MEGLLDKITNYIEKNDKIYELIKKKIGDPLLDYAFSRLYPYLLFSSIIFLLVFFGLVMIIIFFMKIKIQ